jgi:lipid-A-disaccharide synthase
VHILISAGEASGEMYGAQLIEALRDAGQEQLCSTGQPTADAPTAPEGRGAGCSTNFAFFGAGGERMRAAGCEIIVEAKDLAVVGITEIVSHLPRILELYKKLIQTADERKPALAVVIDSPAFNWRVARQMHRRGIPVVYYVCPQFWAWRQGRVKLLRKYVNKALVIFPFEEKFYRDRGVDATFVGHPLADLPMPVITRDAYLAQYGLDPVKPLITLMPGSRRKEVRMNLPPMLEAVDHLGPGYEFLLPVARTLEASFVAGLIATHQAASLRKIRGAIGRNAVPQGLNPKSMVAPSGTAKAVPYPKSPIHLVSEALPALRLSRAAVVASGTATVEAAFMETPFVMVYRVSPLTYALGKPRVKVSHYAMVNLIAGEEIVPELVQHKCTADNIVAELAKIVPDGAERETMIRGLKSMREKLRKPSGVGLGSAGHSDGYAAVHPADRAAEIIIGMLNR